LTADSSILTTTDSHLITVTHVISGRWHLAKIFQTNTIFQWYDLEEFEAYRHLE
jgi:hypothetical protein